MNITESHFVVAFIIWLSAIAGFICSLTSARSPRILALGNCFGGGVLLAAGLVHLSNDCIEDFDSADEDNWSKRYDFPWGAFFVSVGFVITLLVEEIVLHILERTEKKHSLMEPFSIGQDIEEGNYHDLRNGQGRVGNKRTLSAHMLDTATRKEKHDHYGAGHVTERGMAVAFVFLLAISCHSFIAGLGLGALTGSSLWSGMIAIIAHKGMATFTLATCFLKANCTKVKLAIYILSFSLVTPLGILCGTLLRDQGGATQGIVVGLAAGSFLYIGILEVISKEMESQIDKIYKLILLLVGWGLMSALAIWV